MSQAVEPHNTVQKVAVPVPEDEIKLRGYIHWPHGITEKSPVEKDRTCVIMGHPHPKLGGDTSNNVVGCVVNSLANGYYYKHKDGRSFNLLDEDIEDYDVRPQESTLQSHVPTSLHNELISQGDLIREALSTSYVTLAVNTRGVGFSEGLPSWFGGPEVKDIVAIVRYAIDPKGPIKAKKVYLVGYSFSAAVSGAALEVLASDAAVMQALRGVCLLSYPYGFMTRFVLGHHTEPLRRGTALLDKSGVPLLMITGSNDEMTTESQLRGVFDSLPMQEKRYLCVPNGSHFWYGEEHIVAKLVDTFVKDSETRVWGSKTENKDSTSKSAAGGKTDAKSTDDDNKTKISSVYREDYWRSWIVDMNVWVWLLVLFLMVLRFGNFGTEPGFPKSEL